MKMLRTIAVVLAASVIAAPHAAAASLIPFDQQAPELQAQRDKQARNPFLTVRSPEPGDVPLKLPVFELPSSLLISTQGRSGGDMAEAPPAKRTVMTDSETGLWYAITDEIPGATISVYADRRLIEGVSPTAERERDVAADGKPSVEIIAADPDNTVEESVEARIVTYRFGLPYVIEVACEEDMPLCYQPSALAQLEAALDLVYAPEVTP
jgi:hypothetical protein